MDRAAALDGLRRELSRDASLWALLIAATGLAGGAVFGLGHGVATAMLGLWAVAVLLARQALAAHLPHDRLGAANRVTLARLALGMPLGGLALWAVWTGGWDGQGLPAHPALAWALVALATVAALLDLADGALARRSGLASAFGARFDMETDAWLILVLSVLVWQLDQAPAWVLAAGLLRYVFVAAGWAWAWMRRPLPPSRRRQTLCVVQIVALIVCLAPVIPPAWATGLAGLTLASLVLSFAVDVAWLARRAREPLAEGASS